ncbi:uncharacterized protein RCC_06648 [Ramularia collo-cygni]|uniref:Tyrosinase copper-binding domain-containing protein n=1 Tax=Ramularia collo-cygni TaxID=112498 RepID=A0A2D3V5Q1_9PEZI|nr:uncharacterized protein RCC_06648 [Ramularia collo-cygni]CZT20790.1 uncharacterized protein RCC_06648 [Ramularia collo-cygni]
MTESAREDYLTAIQCLKDLPPQTSQTEKYPGVQNRYDDFTIAHAINTGTVHRSPWLPIWHRHYIYAFEKALREECGYAHGHPYWHWSRYLDTDPNSWPMFDNSPTSISGNGTQTGEACACVMEGPLKDWKVTLGPSPNGWGCKRNPREDGFGYNPRCIERTFNVDMLEHLRFEDVVKTIEAEDPNTFSRLLELESPSVHNYPHIFMGGTQIEVTFSSQDPWFFFHHMMVEYIFDIWQSLDYDVRTTTLPDPEIFDSARRRDQGWSATPRPNLDSEVFLSEAFENVTVREAMWPTRGKYCWRYE